MPRKKHEFGCDQCGLSFLKEHGLKVHKSRMHKATSTTTASWVKADADFFHLDGNQQEAAKKVWEDPALNDDLNLEVWRSGFNAGMEMGRQVERAYQKGDAY